MPPRQRIILNPGAGSVEEATSLEQRLSALADSELIVTETAGDATRAAREGCEANVARVVAAGGDGTLHEVVQGMADHFPHVQLGLIPLGTGNDFARTMGIPTDLEEALRVLDDGHERAVDVLHLELSRAASRWVVNASSAGFSAVVSEHADEMKEGWGALGYSIGAMKALPELQAYRLRVQVDDAPIEEVTAWAYVVANGRSIAGGIPVAPEAQPDDGRADVLVVPEMPMSALAVVLPKVLLGKHADDPALWVRAARRLRVEADPPMPINADGEIVGETPATYTVHARRIRLLVKGEEGEE